VTRTHNRFYKVSVDGTTYLCSPKGAFRNAESPEYRLPVIGDEVEVQLEKKRDKGVDGYITTIVPRTNRLLRADADGRRERVMAANLDMVMVVSAVVQPGVDFALIDRYILSCELARIPYALIINKWELDPDFITDPDLGAYADLDIPILATSAKTGEGLDTLKEWVGQGICLLTGTSGVGKSTLINGLVPDANLVTGEVDAKKGRGKHTTTFSSLVPLPDGGFLVDSPGLRDFYPPKVRPEEVRFGFREIVAIQSQCKFTSCLHDLEPGCAVADALEEGIISPQRFKSYLFLLGEMQNYYQNRFA